MMDTIGWAIMKMVLALGVVSVVIFVLGKLLRRTSAKRGWPLHSEIRLLATQPIAPQKYISLVEIGGEVLALGISEAQITFLTKIENKEVVERIVNGHRDKPESLSLLHYFHSLPFKPRGSKARLLRRFYGA